MNFYKVCFTCSSILCPDLQCFVRSLVRRLPHLYMEISDYPEGGGKLILYRVFDEDSSSIDSANIVALV